MSTYRLIPYQLLDCAFRNWGKPNNIYQITTLYLNILDMAFFYLFLIITHKKKQGTICWNDVIQFVILFSREVISIFLSTINIKVIASYLFKGFKVCILQST